MTKISMIKTLFKMFNKHEKSLLIGLSFVLGLTIIVGCNSGSNGKTVKLGEVTVLEIGEEKNEANTSQVTEVSYQGEEGKTAFELLKTKAKVEAETSDFGVMVTSIDSVKNDQKAGKYWLFYVNEKMAEVAADKYATKAGEEITWKYGE